MYESRHRYLDLVHIWILMLKMEEIKELCSSSDFAQLAQEFEIKENICWERNRKDLFNQKKFREKNEDKNAKETHNGQRDKANETEILKMLQKE